MRILGMLFLFLWQLPQNIIGATCSIRYAFHDTYLSKKGKPIFVYFKPWYKSAISLGDTIIMDTKYHTASVQVLYNSVHHEYGHQIQSKILGPLYLILIGLPSLIGNLVFRSFNIPKKYYYKLPWEWWADKLGGVVRV